MTKQNLLIHSGFKANIYFFLHKDIVINLPDLKTYLKELFVENVKIYKNDIQDDKCSYNIYIKELIGEKKHFNFIAECIYNFVGNDVNIFYKDFKTKSYNFSYISSNITNNNKNEKFAFINDDDDDDDE